MPYKCVARNDDPRPTLEAQEEMDIMFGKITRKPEHHPFYNYLEVNVVQETCNQDQFNVQGYFDFQILVSLIFINYKDLLDLRRIKMIRAFIWPMKHFILVPWEKQLNRLIVISNSAWGDLIRYFLTSLDINVDSVWTWGGQTSPANK